MLNFTLYKRGIQGLWKLLLIFAAILTLYVSMIISMFDPALSEMLEQFSQAMPEIMAAVGMSGDTTTLLSFMATYLYGFILIVFPMVFSMLCGYKLMAKYMDQGSMVSLLAAPVKRYTVVLTQIGVMKTCIFALLVYTTLLQLGVSYLYFPEQLEIGNLLRLNAGLLCLQMFIASICFFCSCAFNDFKYSVGLGVGIPAVSFILNMLAHVGEKAEVIKYFTFFTLFDPQGILSQNTSALWGCIFLLIGACLLFVGSVILFNQRDLHI